MYSGQEQEFNALSKGNKSGADAYLSKLCHHQELINTISQLLPKKKKSVP
jgi:DNA-binding response OmpR family regulator